MDTSKFAELIDTLETKRDMNTQDFAAVIEAMHHLISEGAVAGANLPLLQNTTDDAMLLADYAFPNWSVHLRGRTNDTNGHWRCTLRESDSRDSDAFIGTGKSPVLAQAVLAAVMRLSMTMHRHD